MRYIKTGVCMIALGLTLAACDPVRSDQGYRIDPEQVAKIESGITTKDQVQDLMGSPSTISTFQDKGDNWYYINSKTEHLAFFAKEVTSRDIIIVKFDINDVVKEIDTLDKSAGEDVEVVERETPTGGRKLGLLEQLFGNLGRFNSAGDSGQ